MRTNKMVKVGFNMMKLGLAITIGFIFLIFGGCAALFIIAAATS